MDITKNFVSLVFLCCFAMLCFLSTSGFRWIKFPELWASILQGQSYNNRMFGNSSPLREIQFQIKTFAFRHLWVKYGSVLPLETVEVWLKHSVVTMEWPDHLMDWFQPSKQSFLSSLLGGVNLANSCRSRKVWVSSKFPVIRVCQVRMP